MGFNSAFKGLKLFFYSSVTRWVPLCKFKILVPVLRCYLHSGLFNIPRQRFRACIQLLIYPILLPFRNNIGF